MIKDEVDALTLQYFINNKFEKSVTSDSGCSSAVITSSERKFYKKRILQLTKDLFKKKAHNNSLQSSFDDFVASSISYFKFADASELLQEEYSDVTLEKADVPGPSIDLMTVNEDMFNKPTSNATLDSFVTTKTVTIKDKMLPLTRPVDITDAKFKTKGVKKKKKKENVQNIYGKEQSKGNPQTEVGTE